MIPRVIRVSRSQKMVRGIFSASRNPLFNCKAQGTAQTTFNGAQRAYVTYNRENRYGKEARRNNDETEEKDDKKRQKMSKVWKHFRLNRKANTMTCIR